MSKTRQATIVALIVTVIVVWGVGLGAALRPGPTASQGSTANTPGAEASSAPAAATSPLSRVTVAPSPTPASDAQSHGEIPTPSPTATATPVPSPTAIPIPSPLPVHTPTIPATGRFLLVNQDEQMMHVYENGIEIHTIPVSTGAPVANAFTPAWRGVVGRYWGGGPFRDTNLWADHMWYLFPGAEGSILIHSVPYVRSGDMKIYDRPDALGVRPASHGCVRISPEDAEWLKAWDPVGVPIEITRWSGEIGPPDDSL